MTTESDQSTLQARATAAIGTAGEKLQDNPMAALVGGVALGVLIGTLLPRSDREAALLGGLGTRINDAARDALDAARSTGQHKLDELGLTKDGAREKVQTLLDGALEAATAAGTAAKGALRGSE